jgi:hypothetical protein
MRIRVDYNFTLEEFTSVICWIAPEISTAAYKFESKQVLRPSNVLTENFSSHRLSFRRRLQHQVKW